MVRNKYLQTIQEQVKTYLKGKPIGHLEHLPKDATAEQLYSAIYGDGVTDVALEELKNSLLAMSGGLPSRRNKERTERPQEDKTNKKKFDSQANLNAERDHYQREAEKLAKQILTGAYLQH